MLTTIEAIYEDGMLKLPSDLPLPPKARVMVTIVSSETLQEGERQTWLRLSQDNLARSWSDPADDVFNDLLCAKPG